jgi:hypothetical protein
MGTRRREWQFSNIRGGYSGDLTYSSPKMYKSRIKKWGLDKNKKECDMVALLRKQMERDGLAKQSSFVIRGRPVDIRDVYHYFKRRGVAPEEVLARYSGAMTPPGISCSTPPPTPSLNLQRSLSLPQPLLVSEQLYFNIDRYFAVRFSNKTWVMNGEGQCINVNASEEDVANLNGFFNYCVASARLVRTQSIVEARKSLSKACNLVASILRAENPLALQCLLDVFLSLKRRGTSVAVTLLINYISELAQILKHPLGQIFRLVRALEADQLDAAIIQAWKCVIEAFHQALSRTHQMSISCQVNFVMSVHLGESPADAETHLRKLLLECEEVAGKSSQQSTSIRFALSTVLQRQAKYAEAESTLVPLLRVARETGDYEFEAHLLRKIASSQYPQGKTLTAEKTLQDSIELISRHWERSVPWAVDSMVAIKSLLRSWGQEEKSNELRAQIEYMIGPDETDE